MQGVHTNKEYLVVSENPMIHCAAQKSLASAGAASISVGGSFWPTDSVINSVSGEEKLTDLGQLLLESQVQSVFQCVGANNASV